MDKPCTGLTSDDAINPAAQLIQPSHSAPAGNCRERQVGLRRHGYPYLSIGEVCTNLMKESG
jgi:hypothetical protein